MSLAVIEGLGHSLNRAFFDNASLTTFVAEHALNEAKNQ
jgi:hypothetical protein